MGNEEKWKANQQKVAHLRRFPGLLTEWGQTTGSTIEQIIPIPNSSEDCVILLSQGKFAIAPPAHQEPQMLTAGLLTARPHLESLHPEAFQEYDRLTGIDQEAGRQARLGIFSMRLIITLSEFPS